MKVLIVTSEMIMNEETLRRTHAEIVRQASDGVILLDGKFRSANLVDISDVILTGKLDIPTIKNGKIN